MGVLYGLTGFASGDRRSFACLDRSKRIAARFLRRFAVLHVLYSLSGFVSGDRRSFACLDRPTGIAAHFLRRLAALHVPSSLTGFASRDRRSFGCFSRSTGIAVHFLHTLAALRPLCGHLVPGLAPAGCFEECIACRFAPMKYFRSSIVNDGGRGQLHPRLIRRR